MRRDPRTGDVILSSRPQLSWSEFMRLRETFGPVPDDFLAERGQSVQDRDPLAGWQE